MASITTLQNLITQLGHPLPNHERLTLINSTCGDTLGDKLKLATLGDEEADAYVKTVLKCASPFCESTLKNASLSHSFLEILNVGLSEGSTFFRALNTLAKNENEADVALTYMLSHFSHIEDQANADPDKLPNMSQFYTAKERPVMPVQSVATDVPRVTPHEAKEVRQPEPNMSRHVSSVPAQVKRVEPKLDPAVNKSTKEYSSCHAYGMQYALCFGEGIAADQKTHILNIDGAPAESARKYDWSRKISVQLTMEEMYRLLAVLQLKLSAVKFMGHGQQHDKTFSVEAQLEKGAYYATLSQSGRKTISVQISAGVGLSISTMIMKQIFLNSPHLNKCTIDELLDTLVRLDIAAIEQKKLAAA